MSYMLRFLLALVALAFALPGAAHLTPNSEVRLKLNERTVSADIIVPRGEYAYATGNPVDRSHASIATARKYLASHFSVADPKGRAWSIALEGVDFVQIEGPPDLHATATLTPPSGTGIRDFVIDWHVLTDVLPGHFALFVLENSDQSQETTILGALRAGSKPLKVHLAREEGFAAFSSAVTLGAHHILGGYDHLMFLLALLLPAPLLARSGRWIRLRPTRDTLAQLGKIVTAFTIGHSITLIGATLGHWSLPTGPVEIAIAASVLLSAIHAVRPLIPGREPLVALIFGLIHGLAFATLIQQVHADRTSGAIGLLGFNVGIELAQLAIVAGVMPALVVLSRHALYRWLRPLLGTLCIIAATAWIANRTTGFGDTFVKAMETAMSEGAWLIAALSVLALALTVHKRVGQGPVRRLPIEILRRT